MISEADLQYLVVAAANPYVAQFDPTLVALLPQVAAEIRSLRGRAEAAEGQLSEIASRVEESRRELQAKLAEAEKGMKEAEQEARETRLALAAQAKAKQSAKRKGEQ